MTLAHRLPYLTPDEERDLALRSAAGDPVAAERLVASHLRVVVKIARSYGRFGLPVNELIQEGTVGLIQAVRKFNPDGGARLGTYAMWWIRASIQDYVVRSWSLVRVGKTAAHKALFFALKKVAAEQRTSFRRPERRCAVGAGDTVRIARGRGFRSGSEDRALRPVARCAIARW